MRIHAILNVKAGALLDVDPNLFADRIERALHDGGNQVQVDLVEPGEIDAAMERVIASDVQVLVVGGGDGTIKAAASRLVGESTALGIIPLGTLNLLARDLGIPFDPEQAAAAIGRGEQRAIDVAEVNGHIFLCASLLGLPIHMAEKRQALRGQSFPHRFRGYLGMAHDFFANRRRFDVEVDDGQLDRRVRALSIAISNNPFAEQPSAIPMRATLDSGQLALYISKHRYGGALGFAVVQRLMGLWRKNPEIDEVLADRIVLRSKRSKVRLSNDGEIEELSTPLHYSIHPKALQVIGPKPS